MDRLSSVERLLASAVRAGIAPGLAAGWRGPDDEELQSVVIGRAEVTQNSVPLTAETWFDLASLTKPLVVGSLALLAVRDGVLGLESRVEEVLAELEGSELGSRTVAQLLTHTSGLPAWEPLYALSESAARPLVGRLGRLRVGEADRHVIYSCPGFITLGAMLQRLAGSSLDEFFTDRVSRPLGIEGMLGFRPSASRLVASGALAPEAERVLVDERGLDPSRVPEVSRHLPDDGNARFLGGVAGNAGLFGTVNGVLELARAYLEPGTLFSADEITMTTANRTLGMEQARALGWQLAGSPGCSAGPALSPSAFGHNGFTGTSLWIDPTHRIAMALLTNRNHPGHRLNDLHPLRRRFHELVVNQLG